MSSIKLALSFVFTLFLPVLAVAQVSPPARSSAEPPNVNTIVERVEWSALANRDHYHAYVLTREYRMYGGEVQEKPSSEVKAEVTFVPPTTKEYKILQASGSSRGENVVRRILEDESKATATGNAPGAISRQNYRFIYLGEDKLGGRRCYILGLQPKRKEKNLVVGRAWVDADTFLVRRIQGQMAKLPSWWLKSVAVTLDFNQMGGMWLQTRIKAVAEVRIFGTHVLTAQAIKLESADTVAENAPPRRPPARAAVGRRAQRVLGAAVPER